MTPPPPVPRPLLRRPGRLRRLAATAAGLALLAGAPITSAQTKGATPAAKPPAPPADEVTAWFQQAETARDAGKFEEAAALLRKAWDRRKTWDIAGNLGLMEKKLGQLVPAAEHLSFALTNLPPTTDDAARAGLARAFATVRAEVASVHVHTGTEGATVTLSGTPKGKGPLDTELFALPGRISIEVKKDGYETATRTLELKKGETADVSLDLKEKAKEKDKEPPPPPERSKVPAFVMGGVGAASLITGGAMLGVSVGTLGELRTDAPRASDGRLLCLRTPDPAGGTLPECDAWRARAVNAAMLGNAGIGFLVAGGVLAAGAVGALLWWPRPSRAGSPHAWLVTPVVSPHGAGAIVQADF